MRQRDDPHVVLRHGVVGKVPPQKISFLGQDESQESEDLVSGILALGTAVIDEDVVERLQEVGILVQVPSHDERQGSEFAPSTAVGHLVIRIIKLLDTSLAAQYLLEKLPVDAIVTAIDLDVSAEQEFLDDPDARPVRAIRDIDDRVCEVEAVAFERLDWGRYIE